MHLQNITSAETTVGENWSVAVTPNDGIADGTTVLSNQIEILQGVPTGGTATITTDGANNLQLKTFHYHLLAQQMLMEIHSQILLIGE